MSEALLAFGKDRRVRSNQDFKIIYRAGRRLSLGELTLVYKPRQKKGISGPALKTRLGLSVSKKVGNAVERNVVKRRLREAFRLNQARISGAFDLVLVVKPATKELDFRGIEAVLLKILQKAGLLDVKNG